MFLHFRILAASLAAGVLALAADVSPVAAVSAATVASFERPPRIPLSRLLFVPADGNFYGTTTEGGAADLGTVFRLNPATGRITTLVSFTGERGPFRGEAPDAALVPGPDGAMYGTTLSGGNDDYGTIFRVTTAGGFSTLLEFTGAAGARAGAVPNGLALGSDGAFYGTTQAGGANDLGTVFRVTTLGALTTLAHFTGTAGMRKGSTPIGTLAASGGTLYGVTQTGGDNDLGTIFKITQAGAFTHLARFTGEQGIRRGSFPAAGLCLHPNGILYGTTESGGAEDLGTVFQVTTNGAFATVLVFKDDNGAEPAGVLLAGQNGALFGTTTSGGDGGGGTVFRITPGGVHQVLASFDGANGAAPRAGLALSPAGTAFGTTSAGGIGGDGTCFMIDASGTLTTLSHFTNVPGWTVAGGPVFDADGAMLVPMQRGGAAGGGTLLQVSASGTVSVAAALGGPPGAEPWGELLPAGDGFLGLARKGGNSDRGTLYRFQPGAGVQALAGFFASTGSAPQGPPALGPDGSIYMVATEGGRDRNGAIVTMSPDGFRTTPVEFSGAGGATPGEAPAGPLVLADDGNFYGVTERGGVNDRGTVFQMTPDGFHSVLVEFGPSPLPNRPAAALAAGRDGHLYGTTQQGGTADRGTVFRMTTGGALTVLVSFTGASGAAPGAAPGAQVLAAPDGTLYGTTTEGGGSGRGTVFRISPDGAHAVLANFTGTSGGFPGSDPRGRMEFGPDGLLYGTTREGGAGGGGTIFRLGGLGPHVATLKAAVAPGVVTLRARVQTGGEATTVVFDYGTNSAAPAMTSPATVTAPESPADAAFEIEGLAPGTTLFYRARAANADGGSTGEIGSVVVPPPIEAWKIQTFDDRDIPDLDDTDADGDANLTEYALLTGGNRPDGALRARAMVRDYPDGRRLSLTLRRDPRRDDVSIAVQAANAPDGPWLTIAASTKGGPFQGPGYVSGEDNLPGIKTVEIRDPNALSAIAGNRFLRVRIER